MTYLTENPWPLALTFFACAIFFLWHALRTAQKQPKKFALACLILGLVPLIIDQLVETDREQVTTALNDLAAAVKNGDVEKTIGYLAGGDALGEATIARVKSEMGRITVSRLKIKDVRVTVGGDTANNEFRANGSLDYGQDMRGQPFATKWILKWNRVAGKWKVAGITRVDPVSGEALETL